MKREPWLSGKPTDDFQDFQGAFFTVDRLGNAVDAMVWWPVCPTCSKSSPEPHDHRAVDFDRIMEELKRLRVEQTPTPAPAKPRPEPEPAGEHLTLQELARYSRRSTKWLLARTKDHVDPLPCERPSAGKVTFGRSAYDKWISRQRPDAVAGVVSDIVTQLRRTN